MCGASSKEPACQCRRHETWVRPLGQEDPLEQGMATHSSIPAWEIPWTEEPGKATDHGVPKSRTQLKRLACGPIYYLEVGRNLFIPRFLIGMLL